MTKGVLDDDKELLRTALGKNAQELLENHLKLKSVFVNWDNYDGQDRFEKVIIASLSDIDSIDIQCSIDLTIVNESHEFHPRYNLAYEVKYVLTDKKAFLGKYPDSLEHICSGDLERHLCRLRYIKLNLYEEKADNKPSTTQDEKNCSHCEWTPEQVKQIIDCVNAHCKANPNFLTPSFKDIIK